MQSVLVDREVWLIIAPFLNCYVTLKNLKSSRTVVLNQGLVEPQGFDKVISGVQRTFSDILTYCIVNEFILKTSKKCLNFFIVVLLIISDFVMLPTWS